MTKPKMSKEQRDAATIQSLKATCPPDLFQILEREGNIANASRASGISKYALTQAAKKIWPVRAKVQAKIDAYLSGTPLLGRIKKGQVTKGKPTMTEQAEQQAAPTIPPWDKKITTHKVTKKDGKSTTFKKIPVELVTLLKQNGNVMNAAARAIGYAGWSTVSSALEADKYESKLHPLVYSALNGLPIKRNGNGDSEQDTHRLGIAVCVVALSEYERLEELAEVMGGHRVFRMASGAGTLVIYSIHDRTKRETFKRLAQRDAKKIVCP